MHKEFFAGIVLAIVCGLILSTHVFSAEMSGAQLVQSKGCRGCHKIEGAGGTLGPALDGVGQRLSAQEIREVIADPKSKNPSSMMPSFAHIPEEEMKALVDYLSQLK
jgi:mono/diheme cytochrome c family protein